MKPRYEQLPGEEESAVQPKFHRLHVATFLFVGSLLMLSVTIGILWHSTCDAATAWKVLNVASPITERLDLTTSLQRLKGELGQHDDIWSQPPSLEVDQAWRDLNSNNLAWVTSQEALMAGKNISTSVKFRANAGYGDDAYPILIDIKHQLHCLDRIRKDLYFDHYYGSLYPDGKPSELHQAHTNHCVSVLLQSLQCDATTDFITYAWYENYEHPHPDFNIERKCGDFRGVQEWANSRQIRDFDDIFLLEKPKHQATLAMSPQALFELGLPNG